MAPERLWFTITIKRHKKGKVCYCILSFSDFIVLVLGLFIANNYHLEQFCKSGGLLLGLGRRAEVTSMALENRYLFIILYEVLRIFLFDLKILMTTKLQI